jgi:hypothetical protein
MALSREAEQLFGSFSRLLARYPSVIRSLHHTDLTIDLELYNEEAALECARALLDAGISALHRLDQPRLVSLQMPSLIAQQQGQVAGEALEGYLAGLATGDGDGKRVRNTGASADR